MRLALVEAGKVDLGKQGSVTWLVDGILLEDAQYVSSNPLSRWLNLLSCCQRCLESRYTLFAQQSLCGTKGSGNRETTKAAGKDFKVQSGRAPIHSRFGDGEISSSAR